MTEKTLYDLLKDCLISTILYISRILLKGIVFRFLWNWFASAIFHIEINLLQSTGLVIIIMFVFGEQQGRTKTDNKQMWKNFYDDIIHVVVYLMFGYILSLLF